MQSKNIKAARTSLIALAIIVPILYIGFAAISIVQDYHSTLEKADLEARSTAAAIDEHADRAVGEADRFLQAALGEVERSHLQPTLENAAAFQSLLGKYTQKLPELLTINLVDAQGTTIATGLAGGPSKFSVSDRDYFRFHNQPGHTGLYISHPIQSRVSRQLVFPISRSLANPDGSLKLLLVAGISVEYFDTFYRSLNLGLGRHLMLVHTDGTILAENPVPLANTVESARSMAGATMFEHFKQSRVGSFRIGVSIFDGKPRTVAYAGSTDHPFIAVTSLAEPEVLVPWRKRVEQSILIGALTIGLMYALIFMLWSRLKQLRLGQVDLEEKNQSLALAAQVFDTSFHAVAIFSADGTILRVNKAFATITGYDANEVVGRNISSFGASFIDADMRTRIARSLYAGGSWQGETRINTKSGEELTLKQSVSLLRDADGTVRSIVAIIQDISEQKLSERRLHQLAHFDVLTNLPNRRTFSERLQHAIDVAARHDTMLAVVFVDIDHFKTINDSLGHGIGDRVLMAVAARLRACLRAGDTVARIGGDEFVILLEGNSMIDTFERVANKLADSLKAAIEIDGREMYVAASMGISVFPQDGADSETLLRNADTAMYRAKTAGRNCWRFFDESMAQHASRRLELETALRRAVEREELVLYYQPQQEMSSGRIVGVEALLRWNRPEHGMISPMEFIPLAEESGLIIPIGNWVLLTACAQGAAWRREGREPVRVAVNIAAKQIRHADFVDLVRDALAKTGLPPSLLELEITESSIIENVAETVNKLHQLKSLGVSVAIDDFGTGYSSLSYLKQLPVNRLKIDRSFVKDTSDDLDDCAIVRTIISMSHNLGLSVIAEGVETEQQLDFLRAQHCDEIQGFLLSAPQPAHLIAGMLGGQGKNISIA